MQQAIIRFFRLLISKPLTLIAAIASAVAFVYRYLLKRNRQQQKQAEQREQQESELRDVKTTHAIETHRRDASDAEASRQRDEDSTPTKTHFEESY